MEEFEKLGVFYLGREYDLQRQAPTERLLLYDSRDLVTHAVCVGMTGSGKTGLCISLIEEAALDGIPSIVIDPKGDLPNLLLTFPGLRGEDFLPWVNPEDAARKGLSVEAYAEQQAELWRKGLAAWGQDGSRIQRLRESAEFVVYTPGSSAGVPVSILKSFAAPTPEVLAEGELFQERVNTTVTSLLGLVGIQADPLQSREHILIANIVTQMWREGRDIDLATLIRQVQQPPFTQIGVLDLESFYPAKERFGLVVALNNLLASTGFSAWLDGEPLDIGTILYTATGKPRVAIFSIAHLSDAERMFFVSLLLNQILGWMRAQPGTTSLRAIVYMDEIYGFLPPVANPPSKQPLLTLLKQARAFGVGVVLATQNPVDLDYKGLSNAGTWFIGRLQTERDKARVMDGLEGATASAGGMFDRAAIDRLLSGLSSRIFLMHNAHEEEPVVFQTRWALSYLRGPLTRVQIKQLMDPYKATRMFQTQKPEIESFASQPPLGVTVPTAVTPTGTGPVQFPPDVPQFFLPVRMAQTEVVYRPMVIGAARVHFHDMRVGIDITRDVVYLTPITERAVPVDWAEAQLADVKVIDLERTAPPGATFAPLPEAGRVAKNYATWSRQFVTWLCAHQGLRLWRSPSMGQVSKPGESERDFRVRLQIAAREKRDQAADALRQKYGPKFATLRERIRRAEQAVEREAEQARQAGVQTAISVGATLLGAFAGRRALSRAATAARGASRTLEQRKDVERARETLQTLRQQLADLEAQFKAELAALENKIDPLTEPLETVIVKPKRADIIVQLVALVWVPKSSG